MRFLTGCLLRVTAMAERAIVGAKLVRSRKTCALGDVAIVAGVTFCALPGKQGDGQKTQKNQASASHIEIVIVLM